VRYDAALRYLDRHINLEAKAGRWEGLSLAHIRAAMSAMGEPQSAYPVVHVTGTNGKGSTVLMITELLKAYGLRVGTYLSPHVERINERIRIDGEPIGDDDFGAAIGEVAALEPLLDEPLSYFEVLTAAALNWFAHAPVDVAVVEVGLLGRWDATNVVDAKVAVVTNIGRDHTDGVGDWRRAIAQEKAGIIKPDSTLVLGPVGDDLRDVFLDEGPAATVEHGRDFEATANKLAVGGRLVDVRTPRHTYEDVFVALHGAHQGDNAAMALAAVEAFFDAPVPDDIVSEAFAAVKVPGRFEVMQRNPLVVIDAAHNPAGARVAIRSLDEGFGEGRTRLLVVGLLQGRDPGEMFDALGASRAEVVVVCAPDWPRAIPADELGAVGLAKGLPIEVVPDVEDAIHRALVLATEDDVILVTGSFYVIGTARRALREENEDDGSDGDDDDHSGRSR
jgi:dihydrofolate synthase/folylpolyglutamate synthase